VAGRFARFTERAQKVLALAQEESQRFNHNYIGTEHMLLGLLRERDGVAARVLIGAQVDLDEVRSDVEVIIGRGDQSVAGDIGLTPRAKKTIELSVDEAQRLNHTYVGTEHLLLGLIREGGGIATSILESRGVSTMDLREQVLATLGSAPPASRGQPLGAIRRRIRHGAAVTPAPLPAELQRLFDHLNAFLADANYRPDELAAGLFGQLSSESLRVLAFAQEEARLLGHTYIGTEHLLLGQLRAPDSVAAQSLLKLGASLNKVRHGVEFIIGRNLPTEVRQIGFTPRAKKVIELAFEEAEGMGQSSIGPEHLLLGTLREGEGIAAGVLESLKVSLYALRRLVLEALDEPLPLTLGRLSRPARKALLEAQLVARWYYHPHVDTDHLLVGLVRARDGNAARALRDLDLELPRVLVTFEALAPQPTSGEATADRVDYSSAALVALDRAAAEAAARGHVAVATGHLLLAVLSVADSRVQTLLQKLGVAADAVRERIEPLLTPDAEG
jgi:ATP-dependent Clp protease ATP-binding subunit ClpA